ncbi:MAG: triose-phosphate isomerase [Pseudomonadota bacterium]
MRKLMVAGNWKMHGSRQTTQSLLESLKQSAAPLTHIDVVVFPSFIYLPQAQTLLTNSAIAYGAQNLYPGNAGAFTGEIAASMLVDLGCRYVLIGHSERRALFSETLTLIAEKFQAALAASLIPVLCIGETLAEREAGQMEAVLKKQLDSIIEKAGISSFERAVIAYEPVWAIGTGKTATPEQAQQAHAYIRQLLSGADANIAKTTRILYGGSVKADNAAGLFAMPDIDGALVGGASLEATSFLAICQAAVVRQEMVRA